MALVEDSLPGVSKVKSEFQVREDGALAQKLQEQEFEGHFNANVQLRRTARNDVNIAKDLQKQEILDYKEQEGRRRDELKQRELEDKAHAEEVAQKIKEEEEIRAALRMQDEIVAKEMAERERKKLVKKRQQEEEDAKLARQASLQEERRGERRREEGELSERAAQILAQGKSSVTRPITPPPPYPCLTEEYQFPSERDEEEEDDDEEDGEREMDETERQALQEAEDERLARELEEQDKKRILAAKKREMEDTKLAKKLQRGESDEADPGNGDTERKKREDEDRLLAKKLQMMEIAKRREREAERKRQQELNDRGGREMADGTEDDLQLAKRLQMEEIEAQRQRRREAQLKKITAQERERERGDGGGGNNPSVTQSLRQPPGRVTSDLTPGGSPLSPHRGHPNPSQSLPASMDSRPPPQAHSFNPLSPYTPAQSQTRHGTNTSPGGSPKQNKNPSPPSHGGQMAYRRPTDQKGKKYRLQTQV